ncbi:MAG: aminotransferase class V-fold PLP-dependent enzyme [Bacteroidota bacterium]
MDTVMQSQKQHFSLRPDLHYLNCAYKAPLLKSGEEAAMRALLRERNPVDISVDDFFGTAEEVRQIYADIIHAKASQISLIPSVSYGFAMALNNLQGKPNGHAITVKDEFPSGYFALHRWCDHQNQQLVVISPTEKGAQMARSWNEQILDRINAQTSVVLLSSVHWMNGLRFDLESIGRRCQEVGAKLLVDGTQSVGALPMDVQKCHISTLICASYKWLLGTYTLGLAYLDDSFDQGRPLEESWMNRTNAKNFSSLSTYDPNYLPSSARYNMGETANFILMPILKTALQHIHHWQPEHIQNYARKLIQPFLSFAKDRFTFCAEGDYFSNHLFSIQLPSMEQADQIRQRLLDQNIYVSVRGDHVRISVHVFNEEVDIDRLMEVLR